MWHGMRRCERALRVQVRAVGEYVYHISASHGFLMEKYMMYVGSVGC